MYCVSSAMKRAAFCHAKKVKHLCCQRLQCIYLTWFSALLSQCCCPSTPWLRLAWRTYIRSRPNQIAGPGSEIGTGWKIGVTWSRKRSFNMAAAELEYLLTKLSFWLSLWRDITSPKDCNQVEAGPIFSGHWIPYLFFRTSPDIIGYSRCPDFSGHVRRPTQLPKLTRLLASAISVAI